jgi:hypothetical protein
MNEHPTLSQIKDALKALADFAGLDDDELKHLLEDHDFRLRAIGIAEAKANLNAMRNPQAAESEREKRFLAIRENLANIEDLSVNERTALLGTLEPLPKQTFIGRMNDDV